MINIIKQSKILAILASLFFLSSCSTLSSKIYSQKQCSHKHHHTKKYDKSRSCCNKEKSRSCCNKEKSRSCCNKEKSRSCCNKEKSRSCCNKEKSRSCCNKEKSRSCCNKEKSRSCCNKEKSRSCKKRGIQKKYEKGNKQKCNKKGCKLKRRGSIIQDDDLAQNGNVIFIHPDGMSVSHWDAIRLYHAGLKGQINYDKLPHSAIYRGTIKGQVTATSNAGATIHAYGIKTGKDSFGMDNRKKIRSISNQPYSLIIEAKKKA